MNFSMLVNKSQFSILDIQDLVIKYAINRVDRKLVFAFTRLSLNVNGILFRNWSPLNGGTFWPIYFI